MNVPLVSLVAIGCWCLLFGVAVAQTSGKSLIPLATGQRCPIKLCGRNEVLRTCSLCYHNTCRSDSVQICRPMCYCGCYCRTGYVRVTANGPCILPKQCPVLDLEM